MKTYTTEEIRSLLENIVDSGGADGLIHYSPGNGFDHGFDWVVRRADGNGGSIAMVFNEEDAAWFAASPAIVAQLLQKNDELESILTTPLDPKIVCLCGSTRFSKAYQHANLTETLAGNIVLTIGCDTKADQFALTEMILKEPAIDALERSEPDLVDAAVERRMSEIKRDLDKLHKHKIDLAEEILVLNVGGYIGDSTRSEIEYAAAQGKTIRYLE